MDFFNFTTKVSIRFGTNSRQVDLVPEKGLILVLFVLFLLILLCLSKYPMVVEFCWGYVLFKERRGLESS